VRKLGKDKRAAKMSRVEDYSRKEKNFIGQKKTWKKELEQGG